MQQAVSENLKQFGEELFAKMVEEASVEQRLRGLSPEERVRGIPPEERLRGLSPEELLRVLPPEFFDGMSEEEAARLRGLLEWKQGR